MPATKAQAATASNTPDNTFNNAGTSAKRTANEHIKASERADWFSRLFGIAIAIVLIIGWLNRHDNYIDAETGIGYTLGITGGVLMLVLLLYPVSKRIGLLRRMMPIRYWFGIHMMLGILGPVLILFHSNFQLGSTNSTVALFSMIIISSSGIAGRYFYTHIHYGLYGSKASLEQLMTDTDVTRHSLNAAFMLDKTLKARLENMESSTLDPDCGFLASTYHMIVLSIWSHYSYYSARYRINRVISTLRKQQQHSNEKLKTIHQRARLAIQAYMSALRKAAGFRMYERLFSYWHVLHIPLFFMMLIAAVIHIYAVHMY